MSRMEQTVQPVIRKTPILVISDMKLNFESQSWDMEGNKSNYHYQFEMLFGILLSCTLLGIAGVWFELRGVSGVYLFCRTNRLINDSKIGNLQLLYFFH